MNNEVSYHAIVCVLFGLGGVWVAGCGFIEFMAGLAPESPSDRQGCGLFGIGVAMVIAAALLGGCATAPVQTKIVEVDKPVAVQPINASQVPVPPPPLGPRPPTLPQAADALLAQVCRFVEFTERAMPLLTVSAGLPPAQAPAYPECSAKH